MGDNRTRRWTATAAAIALVAGLSTTTVACAGQHQPVQSQPAPASGSAATQSDVSKVLHPNGGIHVSCLPLQRPESSTSPQGPATFCPFGPTLTPTG